MLHSPSELIETANLERQWRRQRAALLAAAEDPELSREAHLLLWQICQFLRDPDAARQHLQAALATNPLVTHPRASDRPPARSVLVLATPGDFQSNLPLDRLFDDSTQLHTLWLTDPEALLLLRGPAARIPDHLPPIDCVFIAIAEDAGNTVALAAADALAGIIAAPVINSGARIMRLSRSGTASLLADIEGALVPAHDDVRQGELADGASPKIGFPLIIRPLGSHAGDRLARLANQAELDAYIVMHRDVAGFTVAPFIDYRSDDGLWRKFRVIFVDGLPYPLHLAIHHDWAVWYYNARMQDWPARQIEEQRFLASMTAYLPPPAMDVLQKIADRVGLDYFGLDCGLMPDGRLLVFEIETGMIVHRGCGPHGARIREAVERMIAARKTSAHACCG